MAEKRKNGAPRRFQWGLLVVGFALGVLLTTVVMQRQAPASAPAPQAVTLPDDAIWLTATHIVQQATVAAAAFEPTQDPALDPFLATATAIVIQATQTAQAGG